MLLNEGDVLEISRVRRHGAAWFATSTDFTSLWFPIASTDWQPEKLGSEELGATLSSIGFLPHGEGLMIHRDGSQYRGSFREGSFAGQGVYQWSCDVANAPCYYTGEFLDGRLHGAGVLEWSTHTFTGKFRRSCPEKGVLEKPGESTKVGRGAAAAAAEVRACGAG
jgi:hypothetical protein